VSDAVPNSHPRYEIHTYSIDELKGLVSEKARAPLHVIESKRHSLYFDNYFEALRAKTMIVENDYVDKDFLEDFAGFYVRCFKDYDRKCCRIHFFDVEIDEWEFEHLLDRSFRG
jgi:hypothetical protein